MSWKLPRHFVLGGKKSSVFGTFEGGQPAQNLDTNCKFLCFHTRQPLITLIKSWELRLTPGVHSLVSEGPCLASESSLGTSTGSVRGASAS